MTSRRTNALRASTGVMRTFPHDSHLNDVQRAEAQRGIACGAPDHGLSYDMRVLFCLGLAVVLNGCAGGASEFDLAPPSAVCRDGTFSYAPPGEGRCAGHDGERLQLDLQTRRSVRGWR